MIPNSKSGPAPAAPVSQAARVVLDVLFSLGPEVKQALEGMPEISALKSAIDAASDPASGNMSKRAAGKILRLLFVQKFPKTFMPSGVPKIPLKIGIFEDLCAALSWFPKRAIGAALDDYKSGTTYLQILVEGAVRVDLEGFPAGIVSVNDAKRARAALRRVDREAAIKPLVEALTKIQALIEASAQITTQPNYVLMIQKIAANALAQHEGEKA